MASCSHSGPTRGIFILYCYVFCQISNSMHCKIGHRLELRDSRVCTLACLVVFSGMWPRRMKAGTTVKPSTRKNQSHHSQPSFFQLVLYANICTNLNDSMLHPFLKLKHTAQPSTSSPNTNDLMSYIFRQFSASSTKEVMFWLMSIYLWVY